MWGGVERQRGAILTAANDRRGRLCWGAGTGKRKGRSLGGGGRRSLAATTDLGGRLGEPAVRGRPYGDLVLERVGGGGLVADVHGIERRTLDRQGKTSLCIGGDILSVTI